MKILKNIPYNKAQTVCSLFFFLLPFNFTLLTVCGQNDTMYIMKNGLVINKQSVNPSEVDSIIFYKPSSEPSENTFTDSRDGNVYQTLTINNQVWMA